MKYTIIYTSNFYYFYKNFNSPAHNALIVRKYLERTFNHRWMDTHGPLQWPPRSPDLTPLDFFVWGYLKTVVYSNLPNDFQDSKNKIIITCA
jgi:hypothetical protein